MCKMGLIIKICAILALIVYVESGGSFENLGKSTQLFSADLYQSMESDKGNVLLSPISIQTILGLLQLGTIKFTSSQIANVLYLPQNKAKLQDTFQNYLKSLHNDSYTDINMANVIYVKDSLKIPIQYKKAAEAFDAEICNINFSKTAESVREINQWVANHTKYKITNLVDESVVNEDLVILLLNALYFNAAWKYPFDKIITSEQKFHLFEGKETRTQMMIQTNTFNYSENHNLNAKFLELPYQGDDYVLTIVLPNETYGLHDMTYRMDEILAVQNMTEQEMTILIPKFKMEHKTELKTVLEQLGLTDIFRQLNIKNLAFTRNLQVSKVLHKAFMNLDEVGTEAAAVTGITIEDRMGTYRKYFRADHPFIFYIRQKSSGVILFVGRFTEPTNPTNQQNST